MSLGYVPGTDPELDLAVQQQAAEQAAQRAAMTHTEPAPAAAPVSANPIGDMAAIAGAIPPPTHPPIPGGAPLTPPPVAPVAPALPHQETEGSTTTSTRTGVKMTPELREAADKTKAAVDAASKDRHAAVAAQEKADLAGQTLATDTAAAADQRVEAARQSQIEQEAITKRYDAADAAARQQVEQSSQALKKFKFRDFWANKSTAMRVGSALANAMGAFGASINHTANFALEILNKEMDDDHRLQVDQMKQLSDDDVRARTGIQDVAQARQQALVGLTIKDAAKDRLIARSLEAAGAKSANENYKTAVDAHVARLRQEADEKDAAAQSELRNQALAMAPKTSTTTTTTKKTVEGAGIGGKGAGSGDAALNAADAASKLDSDIGSLDNVLATIQAHPKAWDEYRNNSESWARKEKSSASSGGAREVRGFLQGVGLADISPEQGLKSGDAKLIHQGMQNALTSIAKGYGGVITQGDRDAAAAGLAVLSQNPAEAMRTLQKIRAELENRRQAYNAVKGVPQINKLTGSGAPTTSPAQGRRIRLKSGEVGTLAGDGTFHPDGG